MLQSLQEEESIITNNEILEEKIHYISLELKKLPSKLSRDDMRKRKELLRMLLEAINK